MTTDGATPEWASRRANNLGFFATADYLTAPGAQTFVVAVLGGSVAQWAMLQENPRSLHG
ncbi:MAG: hypothetical protein R2712_10200 [Vicinamibacterales bacterium]